MPAGTNHPLHAAFYDAVSRAADRAGLEDRRRRLIGQAQGRVLEVGGGTGLNLPHYVDVEHVTVLEPDAAMRRRMRGRVSSAGVPVEVVAAGIDDAELDSVFDTVVCSLVLCSVPDQRRALGRIRSLLHPSGRLLFLEHVLASGARATVQRLASPVWSRLCAGCRLDRQTTIAMRETGFAVTDCERFRFSTADVFTGVLVQGVAIPRVRP